MDDQTINEITMEERYAARIEGLKRFSVEKLREYDAKNTEFRQEIEDIRERCRLLEEAFGTQCMSITSHLIVVVH